ncbi:MAG: hypothetical protein JJE18_10525 [Eubacteriaceae bacterium]|nr:hypothetical protein [Eubacteriaceae bacterium]
MSNKVEIKIITTDDEWVFYKIMAIFSKKRFFVRSLVMSSKPDKDIQEYSIVIESAFWIKMNILPQLNNQIGIFSATMERLT